MLVMTTGTLLVSPTAVSGKATSVGATVNGNTPWPDIEIEKLSPSMPMVVADVWSPGDDGSNV